MSQAWIAYRQWGAAGKLQCEEKKEAQFEGALRAIEQHTEARATSASQGFGLGISQGFDLRISQGFGLRISQGLGISHGFGLRILFSFFFCPRSCPQNSITIINSTMLIAIRQTNPMHI